MSNGISTLKKSSRPGSGTDTSATHPSSPIYLPSGVNSLEEWLTSLQADSPVSHIRSQGLSEEPQMTATSGLRRSELSVRWDRDTSSWKTYQVSFLHLLTGEPQRMGEPWSESLPPSGTVSIGEQSELKMWAHPTNASGGGALGWPTPRESESYQGDGAAQGYKEAGFKQPTHRYDKDGKLVLRSEYGKTGQGTFDTTLTTAVAAVTQNWPTPSTMDYIEREGLRPSRAATNRTTGYLSEAIVQQGKGAWATSQSGPLAQETQTHGSESSESDQTSPRPSPKRLNPRFVEWLMGLPIGWTDLRPMTE